MAASRLEMLESLGHLLTDDEAEELSELRGDTPAEYNEGHYENLAERMDANERTKLAQYVIDWFREDDESRRDWQWRMKLGIEGAIAMRLDD